MVWSYINNNLADIEFRTRKDVNIANGFAASARRLASIRIAMMLRDDEKPCYSKSSGIGSVYDTVEYVECSKGEAMEGTLCPNMRCQKDSEEEGEEGVDVHGKLERREVQASQKGEEAI